jgi:uncharacterized protein (TIGR03437 family)
MMNYRAAAVVLLLIACQAWAAKRVLFVTATAGFRHQEAIEASMRVMQELARESGVLEVVHTEDVSLVNANNLRSFDAVYFFTSGELPMSDRQKADLLEFVRSGKGFGASHSGTDTFYTWPEYGDMVGAYFDGHPWAQDAAVDVEDPQNPIVAHLAPGFRAVEEYYQYRNFSRDRVRVLLTLDTRSVDLNAPGVNRTDGDFALVWIRSYGSGRVFHSGFGHFTWSWELPALRTMLLKALLWLTGEIQADASPRSGPSAPAPVPANDGVRNLSGAADAFAPGALVTIAGERLTSGSSLDAASVPLPLRLAGTHVEVNGTPAPLFSVAPGQLLAQLPTGLVPGQSAALTVSSVNRASVPVMLRIEAAVPSIVAGARVGNVAVLYVTGLGATDPAVAEGNPPHAATFARTRTAPEVRIGGQPAAVTFSGLAPGLVGVYQVNAEIAAGETAPMEIVVEMNGRASNTYLLK